MFTNIFCSSDKRDDSTVSDDDDLQEEQIYNNTITCVTNSNTYNNLHAPGAWMSALAREYISNGMGHMLSERFANSMDELVFVRLSQIEINATTEHKLNANQQQEVDIQLNDREKLCYFSKRQRLRYKNKSII